jgi:hypothetical protein
MSQHDKPSIEIQNMYLWCYYTYIISQLYSGSDGKTTKHNILSSYISRKTLVKPKTFHILYKVVVIDDILNQLSMPCTLVNKDVSRTCQGLIGKKITIILSFEMWKFTHRVLYNNNNDDDDNL